MNDDRTERVTESGFECYVHTYFHWVVYCGLQYFFFFGSMDQGVWDVMCIK